MELASLYVKMDPRLHWLTSYTATEHNMSLAAFISTVLGKVLVPDTLEDLLYADPTVELPRLNLQDLWHPDEAIRLFNVAMFRLDWLSRSEMKMWKLYRDERTHAQKQPTANSFREFYYRDEE